MIPGARDRALSVGAVIVLTLTVAGYLTGTRMPSPERRSDPGLDAVLPERAPSYAQMRESRRGPNANMYHGAFEALAATKPGLHDPVVQSEADYQRALAARSSRRAYEGAPPTVPHAVDSTETAACLGCHGKDVQIAGKRATRLPHPVYVGCVQCHAPELEPFPGAARPAAENDFAGLESPGPGSRAWTGAPPTIPHSTWMRDDCTACHGTSASLGLRTTHPWRQSCQQCHTPSAVLNQRAQ